MRLPLKHGIQVEKLQCSLLNYSEKENREAHCFSFSDINDEKNFVPRALSVGRDECSAWALSFFEKLDQAKNRLLRLANGKPLIYTKLGDHIASGILNADDGISGLSDGNGHFNHFEYEGVDFRTKFTVNIKVAP